MREKIIYSHRFAKNWALLLIVFAPFKVFSQAFAINTDIQRINIAMFEPKRLFIEVDYNLFFDQAVKSSMKGIIKKDDRKLYQKIGEVTVVKDNDYSVFVHDEKKLVVVDPNPVMKDPIKKEDLLRINIDTLKSWISSSEMTETNNLRTITIHLKRGEYSTIILDYDPKSYFLKRMELHAKETYYSSDQNQYQVWMEVSFIRISTEQQFSNSDFAIDNYVTIKDKETVKAVGTYKKYTLINNLNKSIKYVKKK